MCIIAAKPAGVKMPSDRYIHNMFVNNDDGAGFMYASNGKVHIEKGIMSEEAFMNKLDALSKDFDLDKLPMVMHFRITTHGGTKPENCHPFPVSDSMGMLKKLRCKTDLGVAHNGIITIDVRDKTISDTMEYVASQLAPLKRAVPKFYKNKNLLQMIYNAIGSKMAIMNADGEITLIGNFYENEGVSYSNEGYKHDILYRRTPYSMCLYDYGDGDQTYMNDYYCVELMWLDSAKGEYVRCPDGELLDGDDFAIDSKGNLYLFDYESNMFERFYAATAHNATGSQLKFDRSSGYVSEEVVVW